MSESFRVRASRSNKFSKGSKSSILKITVATVVVPREYFLEEDQICLFGSDICVYIPLPPWLAITILVVVFLVCCPASCFVIWYLRRKARRAEEEADAFEEELAGRRSTSSHRGLMIWDITRR